MQGVPEKLKGIVLIRWSISVIIIFSLWGPPIFRAEQIASVELIQGGLDQSALIQMLPLVMSAAISFIFVLLILQQGAVRTKYMKGPGSIFLGFGCLALASAIYSAFPLYTIYKSSILITSLLLVLVYFTYLCRKWYDLLILLIMFNFLVVVNNLIFLFIDPESVRLHSRLIGGKFFIPDFGGAGALILLLGFTMLMVFDLKSIKNMMLSFTTFSIGFIAVYLSGTRGVLFISIAQMMVVVGITVVWGKKFAKPFVFCILVGLLVVFYTNHVYDTMLRGGDSLNTLSGRFLIWQYYTSYFLESPLFGGGYAAASREIADLFATKTSAHSGWIQILVSTGVVGTGIVLSLVFVTMKYGLNLLKKAEKNSEISEKERVLIIVLSTSALHWFLDPPFQHDIFPEMLRLSIVLISLRAAYLHYFPFPLKCRKGVIRNFQKSVRKFDRQER